MAEFPSLPLFTDAYLADTRHLSATEHGAYLLLLMMAWRTPDCRLPDDDAKLAKWACVDARTWKRIKPTIMEFWTPESGTWTQRRLAKEREYVSKRAEVARGNGSRGGRPKALKVNAAGNPAGSSRGTQQKAPNPNPNPNPREEEKQRAPAFAYDRLIEAASARGPCHPNLVLGILPIMDLIGLGFDLESDILPVIREKAKPEISSWKYFIPAIRQRREERTAAKPAPVAQQEDWAGRLKVWRQGTWAPAWGPKPGERNCRVPPELLHDAAA